MEKFDSVFLGGGPAGPSIFDHYARKMKKTEKYILLTESTVPEGAITKGAKVVNQIIPKLPLIRGSDIETYREIAYLVKGSEIKLELLYQRAKAFAEHSEIGIRYCRNEEEFDVLKSIEEYVRKPDADLHESAAQFLEKNLGHKIDLNKLFSYGEKVWNVNQYMKILISKINPELILPVKQAQYDNTSGEGIILELTMKDGSIKKISTQKLFVCKGIGNIEFEKNVKSKESSKTDTLNLGILKYYKCIYKPQNIIPKALSSIVLPEHGICITNEQNDLHSLLYDINSKSCPARRFNIELLPKDLTDAREKLTQTYPKLPTAFEREFMCTMAIDSRAYTVDHTKHFKFVISSSVVDKIHYINLPYFTVIGAALNDLPDNLKDLK